MLGPTKKLGSIGSAVLTFVGYKHTDRQRDKFIKGVHKKVSHLHLW